MKNEKNKGFTLLEILLYIALAALLFSAIAFLFISSMRVSERTRTINEVEWQGTEAMQIILAEVRSASGINSPATGTTAALLSLSSASSTKNPIIIDSSSSTLRIKSGLGNYLNLISGKIRLVDLQFSNPSQINTKGVIKIQFTLGYDNPNLVYEYDYQKTFYGSASLR